MLILREEYFVEDGGDLYIVGSSNNELYRNNLYQMGDVTILGWSVNKDNYDISRLKKLEVSDNLKVHLYPDSMSFMQKVSVIKKEIRECDSVSLKMTLFEAYIGCHYALKYKKPFIIESGTYAWNSLVYHGGLKFKLAAIPLNLLAKYYHRRAKYVIYVSRWYLQERYPSRAKQIGCPDVVLDEVNEEVLKQRLEKIRSKSLNSHFVLGLIGQTGVEYRGHDTLIEVASNLVKKGFDIEVRFLGGGTADDKRRNKARELCIEDRVFFDGYLNHLKVLEWIDNVDILVMPTLAETLGRSTIEAMSRGCLVIGSKETALNEQLGSDCIAPARDVEWITSIAEKMISNAEYASLCAKENYYRAKKYSSVFSNDEKRLFYQQFYKDNNINAVYS